jgi:6-phosphogluconolactonase
MSAAKDSFRLVLSGGATPIPLFHALVEPRRRGAFAWSRVEFFWADERAVPWDDPASNYGNANAHLLSRLPIKQAQVHPIPTEGPPEGCAHRYEELLKTIYGASSLDRTRPLFDLVLLGVGDDGHIASLFPGQTVLNERVRWVASTAGRAEPRITLTFPTLESSLEVAFYVTGLEKRAIVKRVLDGDLRTPAARLRPHGQTAWFLDRAAAGD